MGVSNKSRLTDWDYQGCKGVSSNDSSVVHDILGLNFAVKEVVKLNENGCQK